MKMRQGLKRTLAAVLTTVLVGSMTSMSVFAQEIGEPDAEGTGVSASAGERVTGARETLNSAEVSKNMNLEYFLEAEGCGSWIERMNLPDYAAGLYNTLSSGFDGAFIEDGAFSEETAVKAAYSNGKEISFNGIEVLNTSLAAAMTDEEWGTIQENLSSAYIAFQRDYPGVFWLSDSPKVIRICTEQAAEDGTAVYNYVVYFVLKTHDKDYDIRKEEYQSAEAVWTAAAERDQCVQEVLAGVTEDDVTKAIVYFNENLEAAAKSMGGDADSPARAWKLLCDNAGVPCVLAYGAGGALEAYVNIDGVWYAANEVKAAEESKKAEEEKKEEKKTEKQESSEKKAEEKKEIVTARPALRSVEKAEVAGTMTRAATEPVEATIYKRGEGGAGDSVATSADIIGKVVTLADEKERVFGHSFGQLVTVMNSPDLYAKVGNEEVTDLKFSLTQGSAATYPQAGSGQKYTIEYNGYYGQDGRVHGEFTGEIPEIKCKQLTVYTSGLIYDRKYKGTNPKEDFTPQIKPGITWDSTPAGNVEVEVLPVLETADDLQDLRDHEVDGGIRGTVRIKLTLTGNNRYNYTLGKEDCVYADREESIIPDVRISYSSTPKTIISGQLNAAIDQEYSLEYNGSNKTPPVEVTVTVDGVPEVLTLHTDYEVRYTNNLDATIGTGESANIHISPKGQRYTWDETKLFNFPFTITKAPKADIELSAQDTKYGKNAVIDLNEYIEAGARITKVDVLGDDSIFEIAPREGAATGGATVEYKITDSESLLGQTATVLVSIGNAKNYQDYKISFPVTVVDKAPQIDFKFEHEKVKMVKGDSQEVQLTTVEGSDVKFTSDDPSVSVDYEGGTATISADSVGHATITATATKTEDYQAAEATYEVDVVPKAHTVKYSFPFTAEGEEYKLEVEEGISRKYEDEELGMTAEEIEEQLREELLELKPTIPEENIVVYDVILLVKNPDGKWEWEEVKDEPKDDEIGFPKGGVRVTFPYPYPEEVNPNINKFAAVHMFTTEVNGKKPGKTESWDEEEEDLVKAADGLQFTVTGLSPIAIGWEEDPNANNPTNPDDPNNPTNPDDPNNPNNPNNPSNPNTPNSNTTTNNPATRAAAGTTTGSGSGTAAGGGTGTAVNGKVLGALTGDNAQILVYAVLFGLTGAVICGLFALRKKPKAKKK